MAKLKTKATIPSTPAGFRTRRRAAAKPSAAMPKTGATTWRRTDMARKIPKPPFHSAPGMRYVFRLPPTPRTPRPTPTPCPR